MAGDIHRCRGHRRPPRLGSARAGFSSRWRAPWRSGPIGSRPPALRVPPARPSFITTPARLDRGGGMGGVARFPFRPGSASPAVAASILVGVPPARSGFVTAGFARCGSAPPRPRPPCLRCTPRFRVSPSVFLRRRAPSASLVLGRDPASGRPARSTRFRTDIRGSRPGWRELQIAAVAGAPPRFVRPGPFGRGYYGSATAPAHRDRLRVPVNRPARPRYDGLSGSVHLSDLPHRAAHESSLSFAGHVPAGDAPPRLRSHLHHKGRPGRPAGHVGARPGVPGARESCGRAHGRGNPPDAGNHDPRRRRRHRFLPPSPPPHAPSTFPPGTAPRPTLTVDTVRLVPWSAPLDDPWARDWPPPSFFSEHPAPSRRASRGARCPADRDGAQVLHPSVPDCFPARPRRPRVADLVLAGPTRQRLAALACPSFGRCGIRNLREFIPPTYDRGRLPPTATRRSS